MGPVLGSVLTLAASGGSGAWQGAGLMLVYTLGLALPFLLLALTSSYVLKHFRKLHPYLGILKKSGWFSHYCDGTLGSVWKCFNFKSII